MKHMSTRGEDLSFIDQRRSELDVQVREVQRKFTEYDKEVKKSADALMKAAGIFDEVQALQKEHKETEANANNKLKELNGELQELALAERFLRNRENIRPAQPDFDGKEKAPEEPPAPAKGKRDFGGKAKLKTVDAEQPEEENGLPASGPVASDPEEAAPPKVKAPKAPDF